MADAAGLHLDPHGARPGLGDGTFDEFERAAEEILNRPKPRRQAPKPAPEPEPIVAGGYDTQAQAYAKGFDAAAREVGKCCGCDAYGNDPVNIYDGQPL